MVFCFGNHFLSKYSFAECALVHEYIVQQAKGIYDKFSKIVSKLELIHQTSKPFSFIVVLETTYQYTDPLKIQKACWIKCVRGQNFKVEMDNKSVLR